MKHNKGESITDWAGRFEIALGRLDAADAKIEEDVKKHVFSNSLPEHMKPTVRMFEMANFDGKLSELISTMKLYHGQNMKSEDNQASALYAQNGRRDNRQNIQKKQNNGYNGQNNKKESQKGIINCHYCGKVGHKWKECNKMRADGKGENKKASQGYQKSRHQGQLRPTTARPVQLARPGQQTGARGYNSQMRPNTNQRAMYAEKGQKRNSGAFVADKSTMETGLYSWIVDSGASSHMTPNVN